MAMGGEAEDSVQRARAIGGFSPEAELCSLMADEIERLRKAIDDIEFWVADSIAKSRAALEEKE